MSIWERIGEGVGYALAAVVLGPPAAMARRERRALRLALAEWCDSASATPLAARAKGMSRRLVKLRSSMEVELDPFMKRATLDVAIEQLPPHARVTLMKAPWVLHNVKIRFAGPPIGVLGIRAESDTLDAKTREAVAKELGATAIGALDTFELAIEGERIVLQIVAPTEASQWRAIADALVAFAEACVRRWGMSYR